jgi:DNA-binding LacI/PurR family transcriptional regulator
MSLASGPGVAGSRPDAALPPTYAVAVDTRPVGLVLARSPMLFGVEPFYMELVAGIEEVLAAVDRPLMLQVVPDDDAEQAAYRRWMHDQSVAAVVIVNLTTDDPRPRLADELGLPAVALASPSSRLAGPHVEVDGRRAVRDAVTELVRLGHRSLAEVCGPLHLVHTQERIDEFRAACDDAGATHEVVTGDYGEESGAKATRALLESPHRPTAIIFDNDVMAVAGLGVARERGLDVPGDLSILAWDDSALCRLAVPALSAMSMDVHELGRQVGSCVLAVLAGEEPGLQPATAHRFVARGSTGPAPAA